MEYTIDEALQYSQKNDIESWVHHFLNSVGDNSEFSKGLKLAKRFWLGPIEYNMNEIQRCCGPERDIQFHESEDNWEKRINKMVEDINNGWQCPPLIVKFESGVFELNDGNHRHEAFKRCGIEKYWVIFWDSSNQLEALYGSSC